MSQRSVEKSAAIVKLVAWSVVAVVLIALFALLMVGQSMNFLPIGGFYFFGGEVYPDADSYSVGDATYKADIKELNIDWTAGDVNIITYDGEEIKIEEKGAGEKDENRMRTRLQGDRIDVKFIKSGKRVVASTPEKTLNVYIPESASDGRISLTVNTASADIYVGRSNSSLRLGKTELNNVSGKTVVYATCNSADIGAVSGRCEINGEYGELGVESVNGGVVIKGTVSGDLDCETVSGNINATLGVIPRSIDAESVSGGVNLTLPSGDEGGFVCFFESVSGSLYFNGTKYSSGFGHGERRSEFSIETVSGSVRIDLQD